MLNTILYIINKNTLVIAIQFIFIEQFLSCFKTTASGETRGILWVKIFLFLSLFVRMKCLVCVAAEQISDSLRQPPLLGTVTQTPTAPPLCSGGPRRDVWLLSGTSLQR